MTVATDKLPTLRVGSTGQAVSWAKEGVNEYLDLSGNLTPIYGPFFAKWVKEFKHDTWVGDKGATGVIGEPTWDELVKWISPATRAKMPQVQVAWKSIGPVQPGGMSLLDMSLTHATVGIPLFPAVDTAWGGGGGVTLIVPEACIVDTSDTSSSPGEAVYLTGASTLRYWAAHLDRDWPLGHKFQKGDFLGRTLPISGQSDHGHWGVNGEAILGRGRQFRYGRDGSGPDYTLGSPSIRKQLTAFYSK